MERISSNGGRSEELFDPAGQLLGHLNGANGIWWEPYVPFDGRLLWYYTQATNVSRYFHVNALGSLSLATDAAGDQLNDQVENYQYDAEGRAKSSTCISGCGSQYVTYNALGQRGQDYQTDYLGGYMTLTYPRDIFGDRTGIWDDRPSQNWLGWDIFWARLAGQRLNMGGASAFIDHADAIGSTTMETDPSGAVDWDVVNGPWGQV